MLKIIWVLMLSSMLLNCASVDNELKAKVDATLAKNTNRHSLASPKSLMPMEFAVGQWVKHKMIDKKNRPSISTYSIVGKESGALWVESVTESYTSASAIKMLVKLDRGNMENIEILKVITKTDDGEPMEIEGPVLNFTKGLYKKVVRNMAIKWEETDKVDVTVSAGNFAQSYKMDNKVALGLFSFDAMTYYHSGVPINGLVKSDSKNYKIELLDFGMTGAKSIF